MKLIKIFILAFMALIIVLGVVGIFLPDTQRVERQITISTSAADVFPYINDLHKFNEWSPWAELDPKAQYTFSGPQSGVGAKMEWLSEHRKIANGSIEVLESEHNKLVKSRLEFGMSGPALSSFNLQETDGGTQLRWRYDAYFENSVSRYFGLLLDLDKWIGSDYDKGLSNIKNLIESK